MCPADEGNIIFQNKISLVRGKCELDMLCLLTGALRLGTNCTLS